MKKTSRGEQREPSQRSLRAMPEVDFRTARVKRNPYARRVAAAGLVVQVGRGRPKRLLESGGTTPRSVRFPEEIWALLERRAKANGLTLHAALREAILEWARHAA
jgi:Ribbon-helix-helix protein, copG family